jgi:hypothetical protein
MVWLRKEKAGSASGGLVWPADGAVIDVPEDRAAELLAIPDGGITEAPGHEPEHEGDPDKPPTVEAIVETPTEGTPAKTAPAAAPRAGSRRKA